MSGGMKQDASRVTLAIDGQRVEAEKGQTVLEAAKAKGIGIPTLCHHPTVEAYGACRLCMVEVKARGRGRLVTSCNYEVSEGLEVETDSQRVRRSRRMTVELLLSRCPEVDALKRLAKAYGIQATRFPKEKDDCILCGLCVRVCKERMGVGAADFTGRGADMKVNTPYDRKSEVCITCGACAFVCPTHSKRLDSVFSKKLISQPSEFDMGMRPRSTVYIPFPQALPNMPVIDRANCVRFKNGGCGACAEACPAGAIDYGEEDSLESLKAGAVILSPGFCLSDPAERPELGYASHANVLSSLQFERVLSASGPCMGNVVRPSDGKAPRRVAFLQCVGSRDEAHEWCSSVCCMYALKEAIIAKEHEHDIECTVFYMDIRAHGKGFEAYYERAKALGIRFLRCRPSRVEEVAASKNLRMGYVTEDGTYATEEFELAVLASGLNPPKAGPQLAAMYGISLDANGFAETAAFNPVSTSRPGVFLCGPFSEPKDIPETVVEASGAAAEAMALLASKRGTLVTKVELPPEAQTAGQEPRIGVFVCHCGKNIGGVVNVPSVAEYAKSLPHVVFAMDNLYTCSSDAQVIIKNRIAEHGLNRVIVASCSPRTHEPLFQQTIREAGLNVHLFEMANIRDQCSWVHMEQREAATAKAKDLVRMAVAKARYIEPLASSKLPVTRAALVVGGGLAGMTAALALADQGYPVHLVEKSPKLGGIANRVGPSLSGESVAAHAQALAAAVSGHPRITVYLDSELSGIEGFVGNFQCSISRHGGGDPVLVKHGVTILAAGGRESKPTEYLYGKSSAVVTLLELEKRMRKGLPWKAASVRPHTAVFIQCVGSREEGKMYCSRICCSAAVKNAIRIKEADRCANVLILYREMRTYGFRELYYARARELGVNFIRYDLDSKPVAEKRAGEAGEADEPALSVRVRDPILKAELEIPTDLLVLSGRVDPNPDNEHLSQFFKVPLSADRFFLEAHAKLRPVDFATDGVFVCGISHYPKDSTESSAQARAAAARASTVLAREAIEAEGKVSSVKEARCVACGACVEVCPYKAVEIDPARNVARVNEAVCKGCGICAATCRSSAVDLKGFRDEQILAMLKVM